VKVRSHGVAGRSPSSLLKKEKIMNALMTRGGLFDDFFRDVAPGFYIKPLHGDALPTPAQIKVDVKETGDAYTVQAEIPGVPKEDIQVAVDGNVVSLRAEIKQQDSTGQDEKTLRSERYFGAVSRSFQLASDIDQSQAKAKYDNGVLTLTLPKKAAMSGAQRLTIE
jgi:HSP20 family protein